MVALVVGAGCNSSSKPAAGSATATPGALHVGPAHTPTGSTKATSLITAKDLQARIDAGEKLTIIDLREPILWEEGHIPGAKNIPYDDIDARMKELTPEAKLVLVCHTGPMGELAGISLAEHGYAQVWNLDGGMDVWKGKLEK